MDFLNVPQSRGSLLLLMSPQKLWPLDVGRPKAAVQPIKTAGGAVQSLTDVPGIGPVLAQQLLERFGSLEADRAPNVPETKPQYGSIQ